MDQREHAQQIYTAMIAAKYTAERQWPGRGAQLQEFAGYALAFAQAFAEAEARQRGGQQI